MKGGMTQCMYSSSFSTKCLIGDRERITAELVSMASTQGDPIAQRLVHETASYMGRGLANVMNMPGVQVRRGRHLRRIDTVIRVKMLFAVPHTASATNCKASSRRASLSPSGWWTRNGNGKRAN